MSVSKKDKRRVSWCAGSKRKTGVIVLDIPARDRGYMTIGKFVACAGLDTTCYDLSGVTALKRYDVLLRNHPSYLVSVDRGPGKKPALFWPRVTDLVFLEERL